MDKAQSTTELWLSDGMRLLDANELEALGGGKNVLAYTLVDKLSDTIQIFANCLAWAIEEVLKPRC